MASADAAEPETVRPLALQPDRSSSRIPFGSGPSSICALASDDTHPGIGA